MLWQNHPAPEGGKDPSGRPAHADAGGLELSQILAVLTERYKLILGAGLVGLLLGIAAALLANPQYRATALVQYEPGLTDALEPGKPGQGRVRGNTQEAVSTQIGLIESESLARRVAQDLNLVANPLFGGEAGTLQQRTDRATTIVQGSTSAMPIKGSTLIQITAVSGDPTTAANMANAMARGHISASLERRFDSSAYARKFLSDQLTRTKAALEESERNLANYAINAGIYRSSSKDSQGRDSEGPSLAQTSLSSLNAALKQAEVNRIAAEQRYRESELAFAGDQAASINALVQMRSDLQAQYDEKLKVYKPDYPEMLALSARIKRLDAAIEQERGRAQSGKRAELYGEYKAAVRIEAELRQRVAEAKGEVLQDRTRSIEYNILQREADTNRALYDALLQRYKEVGVAGGIGQSEITLVDEARPPRGPFKPRPMISALVGLLAGLAAGIGLAFVLQLLFDTIAEPRDVRSKLHLPVLGSIPTQDDGRLPIEALADRKSELSEAYHSVRTALRFSQPEGMPHSLLVTSTRPAEGKSTSAYAVALSIAKLGGKVLLIDADLRKPTFAANRSDGHGLAHLLGSEDPLLPLVETTRTENLHLLPVGSYTGSAAELLGSNRLPLLVAEARQAFDTVVIDAPPVLGLADAPLLASVVDATILVVESKGSRTSEVQEMVRRLTDAGAKLVGVILTKVPLKRSRYGYGYYAYEKDGDRTGADSDRQIDIGAG